MEQQEQEQEQEQEAQSSSRFLRNFEYNSSVGSHPHHPHANTANTVCHCLLSVSTHEMALRRTANEKDFASQTFIVSEHAEITSDANLTHWQMRETDPDVIRQDGPKSAQMPSIFDTANI